MRYWTGLLIALAIAVAVKPQPVVCAEQETPDEAIGRLARAIQLDPHRRDLWVALDRAIAQSGRATITDAELTRAARMAYVRQSGYIPDLGGAHGPCPAVVARTSRHPG